MNIIISVTDCLLFRCICAVTMKKANANILIFYIDLLRPKSVYGIYLCVVSHTYKSLIKTFIYNTKLDVANEATLLFR
jgi:hypothetical protein